MNAAIDTTFDTFVASLYAGNALPPVSVVNHIDDTRVYYRERGMVPVLAEDESKPCPVFGNWSTHYEFEAWRAYREMYAAGSAFKGMVLDILERQPWSPESAKWITIIDGLVNVQRQYADKFGHTPVDTNKFIKSYVKNGAATVLRRDTF